MLQTPSLIQSLARDHTADLHRQAGHNHQNAAGPRAGSHRSRAGWFLIGLGMHLALPREPATNRIRRLAGN